MRNLLIAFILAMLAGYGVARLRTAESAESARDEKTVERVREIGGSAHWGREEFVDWLRTGKRGESGADYGWGEWSDEELREALDELTRDPRMFLSWDDRSQLVRSMFGDWMRRAPDAALAWFEALPSEGMRRSLSGALAGAWPKARPEEGMNYVIAHRDLFEGSGFTASGEIIKAAIDAAAKKGPEAVDAVFGKLVENRLSPRYAHGWEFPEGFDFARLMAGEHARKIFEREPVFFAGIWMSRNPDEAFQHLVAGVPADKVVVGYLFQDVLPTNHPPKTTEAMVRAEWLGRKLGELPPDDQKQVVERALKAIEQPEVVGHLLLSMEDGPVKDAALSSHLGTLASGGVRPLLAFLETADDPAWRVEQLERADFSKGRSVPLSEAAEKELRGRLASWNVPAQRAEGIVSRIKKP